MPAGFDAVILAGGRARRLGDVDKSSVDVGGRTLLEWVLDATGEANRRVVVGPRRALPPGVVGCREDPPGAGPVAAVAAGLGQTSADVVLLLAADMPRIAPAVRPLLAELDRSGAALSVLVDQTGRRNLLASAWRRPALTGALATVVPLEGAAMRVLATGLAVAEVADPAGWGRDCDTWRDVDDARRIARRRGEERP